MILFQEFWVFPGEVSPSQLEHIQALREALVSCEPIKAELDRGLKVLLPSQVPGSFSCQMRSYKANASRIAPRESKLFTFYYLGAILEAFAS